MKYNRHVKKKRLHQINEEIRASNVRLIDEEKNQVGIVTITKALEMAREKELDLVAGLNKF